MKLVAKINQTHLLLADQDLSDPLTAETKEY